ncbi:MAG: SAM-dependent methyltransferase [Actinobacteria bacterium]|nr:SAM-dependent methyltransferase [Actinomycetota bacterium]MBI3687435.1 SAM-dependent methyltransferase [Actinomycetota bacterium]
MYDYFLGGENNFAVDRAAAAEVRKLVPDVPVFAWENRQFLRRAVTYLAREVGITQFLDIGSGLPTVGNVHEIAQEIDPDIHVVYVDNDPLVAVHASSLLLGLEETVTILTEDLRDIDSILHHPRTRRLIDFTQPVGVLLASVLPFLPDEADPAGIMATIRGAVAPGSHLVISHSVTGVLADEAYDGIIDIYRQSTAPGATFRPLERVRAFFDGWDLLDPGLVPAHRWRPATDSTSGFDTNIVGAGRKP